MVKRPVYQTSQINYAENIRLIDLHATWITWGSQQKLGLAGKFLRMTNIFFFVTFLHTPSRIKDGKSAFEGIWQRNLFTEDNPILRTLKLFKRRQILIPVCQILSTSHSNEAKRSSCRRQEPLRGARCLTIIIIIILIWNWQTMEKLLAKSIQTSN